MKPTTTQQTAKKWKLIILLGQLGLISGLGWIGALILTQSPDATAYSVPVGISMAAFPVYLVGRIGKWWFHE